MLGDTANKRVVRILVECILVLLPPANEVCEGYVFTGVCLSTGGVCVVAPVGGHAWLLWGGMHGCSWGGMHGCSWGHAWLLPGGPCVVKGTCVVKGGVHREGGHV